MLKYVKLIGKHAGEDTDTIPHYFTEWAYKNVPINHVLPYDEWYDNVLTDIISDNRFEYIAYDENDMVIGAMTIHQDYDPCVGDCLYVKFAYSHNPVALRNGYRMLLKIAKQMGYKHVIYTKLIKGKRYITEYREVK